MNLNKNFYIFLTAIICLGQQVCDAGSLNKNYEIEFIYPVVGQKTHTELACEQENYGYQPGMILEKVFKNRPFVQFTCRQTLGDIYTLTYPLKYGSRIISEGKKGFVLLLSAALLGNVIKGKGPYLYDHPAENIKAICAGPGKISLFVTFDPKITHLTQLTGKHVGIAERMDFFQGEAEERPYFGKVMNIYKDVHWVPFGAKKNMNLLLKNKIDAMLCSFTGCVEMSDQGFLECSIIIPDPITRILLNSRKTINFIPFDPLTIKKAYDFRNNLILHPILIKNGAHSSIKKNIWARGNILVLVGPASIPDNVVEEIIRTIRTYKIKNSKIDKFSTLFPNNPYPFGVPNNNWIHPGIEKAIKNIGASVRAELR